MGSGGCRGGESGLSAKISRTGEMGCRDRQSEATAEKRCPGLRTGGRDGWRGWESSVMGGE